MEKGSGGSFAHEDEDEDEEVEGGVVRRGHAGSPGSGGASPYLRLGSPRG
jgi:hypothetical protein